MLLAAQAPELLDSALSTLKFWGTVAVILALGIPLLRTIFGARIKGRLGEQTVIRILRRLDPATYQSFHDLYLPRPDGQGTTHILMKLVQGETLKERLRRRDPATESVEDLQPAPAGGRLDRLRRAGSAGKLAHRTHLNRAPAPGLTAAPRPVMLVA